MGTMTFKVFRTLGFYFQVVFRVTRPIPDTLYYQNVFINLVLSRPVHGHRFWNSYPHISARL